MPIISVITRTKDRLPLLSRCTQSLIAQTRTDWEQLIVNNSTDQSLNGFITQYSAQIKSGQIRILQHPRSVPLETLTNFGLKKTKSKYVLILDDDDTLSPHFLENTIHYLESHPQLDGVVTHTQVVDEHFEHVNQSFVTDQICPLHPNLAQISLWSVCAYNTFPPCSFVYRRQVGANIGFYKSNHTLLGDWDFNLRFLASGHKIGLLPYFFAFYHQRPVDGTSFDNTVTSKTIAHLIARQKIRHLFYRQHFPWPGILIYLSPITNLNYILWHLKNHFLKYIL